LGIILLVLLANAPRLLRNMFDGPRQQQRPPVEQPEFDREALEQILRQAEPEQPWAGEDNDPVAEPDAQQDGPRDKQADDEATP
jgi:hypothetical protein